MRVIAPIVGPVWSPRRAVVQPTVPLLQAASVPVEVRVAHPVLQVPGLGVHRLVVAGGMKGADTPVVVRLVFLLLVFLLLVSSQGVF